MTHTFDNEDYTFEVFLEFFFFLVSRKLNMKINILS